MNPRSIERGRSATKGRRKEASVIIQTGARTDAGQGKTGQMKSERKKNGNGKPGAGKDRAAAGRNDFLIAAIGASAGGIEAVSELLQGLPADTGIAFVLVQHLDPTHHSFLTELLSKQTAMPVREATNGMRVEPSRVYVIPPNATMTLAGDELRLGPRENSPVPHMAIDSFMRSLAKEKGPRAIGVILSGSGTDGTLGIAEIQAQGGVTFAQDETTAKYASMPRSAAASGCVDYVLPPKGISKELARIARHPYIAKAAAEEEAEVPPGVSNGMSTVFQMLRRATSVDFTHYRQTTILRRIHRRMVVHKLDHMADYVRYLQTNPAEIKALYQDMLINVTSFFRDPQIFEALKTEVFPAILKGREADSAIRIWTPGCASGEETYSVAIALLEFLGNRGSQAQMQFFGTDVSETSIARARAGVYPENIQGDVSPERLQRFFTRVERGYRISKTIRDTCIFAQHNVLNDPPFSQMDLICCRNLLIYLEPVLQNKVISLFHYAAKPGGYLVLGASEGVGSATSLFSTVDRAYKIFAKKATAPRQVVTFSLNHAGQGSAEQLRSTLKPPESAWNYIEVQKEFDRRLLAQYAPAAVFVNEDLEIIHTRGNVNRYLKLAPGRASLNVLKMAREGLVPDLRNALARARKEDAPVKKQNVSVKSGNGNGDGNGQGNGNGHESMRLVSFEVIPISMGSTKERYYMVVFQEELAEPRLAHRGTRKRRAREEETVRAEQGRVAKLEHELSATKEYLQSVIETQEAMNEELQSANEEILSSNEELQSTNEELETAKEELQSANEELSTVNDELRNRNIEVTQVNNDLTNLLSSIDIAVVMVDKDLTIRRLTPQAQKLLGLIPGDIGRPFLNINPTIAIPDLQAMVLQVMSKAKPVEKEAMERNGRYLVRILPYRTAEDQLDGAVITLIDTTPKTAEGN